MKSHIDDNPLRRAAGLSQAYARLLIKQALFSDEILVVVKTDWYGQIKLATHPWEIYWADVVPFLAESEIVLLQSLRRQRQALVNSNCNQAEIAAYCASYHALLDAIMRKSSTWPADVQAIILGRILGFECFTIKWHGANSSIAAATSTSKNPNYLLSRLKFRQSQHDSKYLAIITTATTPELFYHYRQIKLDDELDIRLLLYPMVSIPKRADSFEILESFVNGCSCKTDPHVTQRAKSLVESVLLPFWQKSSDVQQNNSREINVVDIGGGTGALVSNMWRYLLKHHPNYVKDSYLSCSIIGLRVQNPLRHFNKGILKGTISYLDYVQSDYLEWLCKQSEKNNTTYDFAMICRLLNNISTFEINETSDWRIIAKLGGGVSALLGKPQTDQLPVSVLKSDRVSKIRLSNRKVGVDNGKTFRHMALSDYYRGLAYLTKGAQPYSDKSAFYPLRQFNRNALYTSDGKSIFERLTKIAKLTIIEDVDLSRAVLLQHLAGIANTAVYASEIKRQGGANVAAVFCITGERYKHALPGKLLK